MPGVKQVKSTDSRALARIRSKGRGWVFTPADFADLGSATAVHLALMRHEKQGTIRRLARGLYDFPRKHTKLGLLAPSPDTVAKALQSRDASRLQPAGAYAANLLGLSNQVPSRIVFYTDGRPRRVKLGKQEIVLKRRSSRSMAASKQGGLLIRALEHLGREQLNETMLRRIAARFSKSTLAAMRNDARYAPAWIADALRKLAADAEKEAKNG